MGLREAVRRIGGGLTARPRARDWARLLVEAAWLFPLVFLLGSIGGLAEWRPRFDEMLLRLALLAILIPALGEEIVFRAAIIPRAPPHRRHFMVVLSTVLFVLWHPLQALVFGPHWAAVMLNPWFLAAVAAAGAAFARLWLATGSIWPPVLLHWLLVVSWKGLFGGPSPWVAPG